MSYHRFFAPAVWLSALAMPALKAQALDIGGIELRLGQSSTSALAALKVAYDVRYEESLKIWTVLRKRSADESYVWVGHIGVDDGLVKRISKSYPMKDPYELTDVLTLALRDAQKRGGTACTTWPQEMTDDRFWGFTTTCGPYEMSLTLPQLMKDPPGAKADPSISVSVPKRR